MIKIQDEFITGTYAKGNSFSVTHNKGNWPDKIYVWDERNRPILASQFSVVNNSDNQFTLTFNDGKQFAGRYELLFTHLSIQQSGVTYDVRVLNGSLYVQQVSPPPPFPDFPPPPGNGD